MGWLTWDAFFNDVRMVLASDEEMAGTGEIVGAAKDDEAKRRVVASLSMILAVGAAGSGSESTGDAAVVVAS